MISTIFLATSVTKKLDHNSYPGTNVLKNKLDIRDLDTLHEAERDYSAVRQAELVGQGVTGDFSFKHLCSIT